MKASWQHRIAIACLLSVAHKSVHGLVGSQQGFATFYGGPQDNTSPNVASFGLVYGSCGYGLLRQTDWPYWRATAISPSNALATGGNKRGCGACVQITCTTGCMANASQAVVLVTDTCNDCAPGQLNVHSSVFAKNFNSDLVMGRVGVQWQQVDCMPPADIKAKVTDFRAENGGFIAIALLEVAGDGYIAAIDIQNSGQGSWSPMNNDHGAVWQASNLGQPPFSLRITGSNQQQLIARGSILQLANGTYPTGVQFGGARAAAGPPQISASPPPATNTQLPASSPPNYGTSPPSPPPPQLPDNATTASSSANPALSSASAQPPPPGSSSPQPPTSSQNVTASPFVQPPAPAPQSSDTLQSSDAQQGAPAPGSGAAATPAPAPGPLPSEDAAGPDSAASPLSAAPDAGVAAAPDLAPSNIAAAPGPAFAPGTTSLMLNSSLSGAAARATNNILNPEIGVSAGRRLKHSA